MMFHDSEMHGVPRRDPPVPEHNLFCTFCDGPING